MKKFLMPKEHIRRICSVRKQCKIRSLASIKFVPHALYTLLATIPMPWEKSKIVEVLYHVNGSVSFVNSKSKATKSEFLEKWSKIDLLEDKEKGGRCMKFPIFEDDEEIVEYKRLKDNLKEWNELDKHLSESEDKIEYKRLKDNQKEWNELDKHLSESLFSYLELSRDKIQNLMSFPKRKQDKLFNFHEIPLIKPDFKDLKSIKKRVEENKSKYLKFTTTSNLKKHLKNTRFFQSTEMDWVEAGLMIIQQSHESLCEIIRKKKLSFIYLDFNFNLKHTRPLTTKERKKSRLGISFHLLREISKLIKFVVDAHVVQRRGLYTSLDLCLSLKYLFNSVGILTGIYRYKYKTMTQIKMCKDLNTCTTRLNWCEEWRVYVFMMRGYNSLLYKYFGNLVDRLELGREYRDKPLKKQRIESNLDLELKREAVHALKGKYSKIQINLILRHMNEAWRCWKADLEYSFDVEGVISTFIKKKAQAYVANLETQSQSKKEINKKLGRISRLWFKEEKERQRRYLLNSKLSPTVAMGVFKTTHDYFQSLGSPKISFPSKNEIKHLQLAVEKIRGDPKEEAFYEGALKEPEVYIFKIKKSLLTQRKFREVQARVVNSPRGMNVLYFVNHIEKLTDAFLSSYLFYEADCLGIFPEYLKPSDEIEMKTLYDFCVKLQHPVRVYEGKTDNLLKNIDINLLKRLMCIFIDPILVDYMISQNNCTLVYKDMSLENNFGVVSGFSFSAFLFKFYALVIDIYAFGEFVYKKKMLRYLEKVYFVIDGCKGKCKGKFICRDDECKEIDNNSNTLSCTQHKVKGLYHLEILRVSSSPHLKFEFAGVDCSLERHSKGEASWDLKNGYFVNLKLSKETVSLFKSRMEQIVLTSQSSTFLKVVSKWNSTVSGFVSQFREAIPRGFFVGFEKKVQDVVKRGINSKMPVRFPAVIFYTPKAYGGLEMYSAGLHENEEEFVCTKIESKSIKGEDFLKEHESGIPNIVSYFKSWYQEIEESEEAWSEFQRNNTILKEVGLPRMSTLLQKNKIAFYDRCFRLVKQFQRFSSPKYDPLIFTSVRHDGKLFSLEGYASECLKGLGGVERVLRHTLFQGTYSRRFDKLFWDESYLSLRTSTKAQKRGLSQIPNRRFILWWSPTINRANVYVGYQSQLEPTGIQMYGKLPTLRMSYLSIFKNNMWRKIHESIVFDFQRLVSPLCDVMKMDTPLPSLTSSQWGTRT